MNFLIAALSGSVLGIAMFVVPGAIVECGVTAFMVVGMLTALRGQE